MSSDSVIEEDILEQIDDDSEEEEDKEIKARDEKIVINETNQILDEENVGKVHGKNEEESCNNKLELDIDYSPVTSKFQTGAGDKVSVAVINFSGLLAENVLQEALLINEIYTKDAININPDENSDTDRDKDIRKHLFPNENGRILSKDAGAGYDSYLLNKLLRSEADPVEVSEVNGFDGNEEHFRSKEETYPGLDSEDAYVKAELDRIISDRELSDKNNNQMDPVLSDQFDDNVLQTIHEDAELVIEDGFRADNKEPTPEESGVNVVNITGAEEIDEDNEAEKGDEESSDEDNTKEPNTNQEESHYEDKAFIEKLEREAEELIEEPHDSDGEASVEEVQVVDDDTYTSDDETDCCEMTFKQKHAVVKAVRAGDINLLEKLLEKKNADMSMTWYGENLLMVAIRAKKQEMAEFLIDNDIDWAYERKLVEVDKDGMLNVHKITARQMAFDSGMEDLVELLDFKMNNLFPFVKPKHRAPILRQPIAPFAPPPLDEAMHEEYMIDPEKAKELQKIATEQFKQRQREIELENIEMMQKRRKGIPICAENESVHTGKSRHTCSDLNVIHDDISQVFGPDEGYETISPISPHRRYFHHIPEMKEHISIRATRSYHLKKAFIASKSEHLKRIDSPDYPMYHNLIETVGSYNFESRKWHHPMSAPQLRSPSMESLHDNTVHTGLPFVHGGVAGKSVQAGCEKRPVRQRRSQSAHSNISPYSQVAKLLEQSRLFSPVTSSRSSTPYFPAISNRKSPGSAQTKTRINYIYADRSSAKPKRTDFSSLKTDLLPKRKLRC